MSTPVNADKADRARLAAVLSRALAGLTGRDPASFRPETRLFLDLGMTSGHALGLIMDLEDELALGLRVDRVEWRHLETVGSLTDYLAVLAEAGDGGGS